MSRFNDYILISFCSQHSQYRKRKKMFPSILIPSSRQSASQPAHGDYTMVGLAQLEFNNVNWTTNWCVLPRQQLSALAGSAAVLSHCNCQSLQNQLLQKNTAMNSVCPFRATGASTNQSSPHLFTLRT